MRTCLLLFCALCYTPKAFAVCPTAGQADRNSSQDSKSPCSGMTDTASDLTRYLIDRGFKCEKFNNGGRSFQCKGRVANYPQPVLIFVPDKLSLDKKVGLNFHFHGYNEPYSDPMQIHFSPATGVGNFGEWMNRAEFNGVTIAPLSLGNCDTFFAFFSNQDKTSRFFKSLQELLSLGLNNSVKQSVSLSSHSGSDATLNLISKALLKLKQPEVERIGLFDSMYSEHRDDLVKLIKLSKIPVDDYYIDKEGSTTKYQANFIKAVDSDASQPKLVEAVPEKGTSHFLMMKNGNYVDYLKKLSASSLH